MALKKRAAMMGTVLPDGDDAEEPSANLADAQSYHTGAKQAAKDTGKTERTTQRDVQRANTLGPEMMEHQQVQAVRDVQ